MRRAADLLGGRAPAPDSLGYSVKRRLLGRPLVNEQLSEQRLSNPVALGVLSPDGISSSAYGTEEILIALLPLAGLAAFTLILPMTLVILFVMLLVVLSYREVVMVYIRPGGSYVVARENFGPRVAQIAAVALLIDYVVTVAVQTVAGTAAVVSAFPALGPASLEITIGVILLICFGNLRGIREAGKAFAVPTYLFVVMVLLMIVVGLVKEIFGDLHKYNPHALPGTFPIGSGTAGIVSAAMIFTLLRAFANGGASLTGIEAVSDAVGAFRPPEGVNARRVLVAEGLILGTLVAGISWLAHVTYATPRTSGAPTVLAQEATAAFGGGFGRVLFYLLQAATALILFTGANTSFNGFPFLASYVAGDAFLPRWLLKRGHRLVFSNAIIVLDRGLDRADHHPRGEGQRPGPAVRDRRVHRVLHGRLRHGQVPPQAQGAGLAAAADHQRGGRRADRGRGGDLRGGQVHRGRLDRGRAVRRGGARADPAEPGVRDGGRGAEHDQRAASRRRRRPTPAARSSCSWTASTWPRWPHCGTPGACGRPPCARCTSSSTAPGPRCCASSGCARTAASCSTSSTSRTGGWSGPRPNWSARRSRIPART